MADALTAVARRHEAPTGAVAVAWTLAFPGVTAAIMPLSWSVGGLVVLDRAGHEGAAVLLDEQWTAQ